MGIFEIFLIGVGLSMDAAAVSMSNAMVHGEKKGCLFEMALMFGIFQGIMPITGFFLCGIFSDVIAKMGKILVMLILGCIGGKMLLDGFSKEEEEHTSAKFTHSVILAQAAATSIDAFAVGVGFRAETVEIFSASALIAVTTFCIALAAVAVGKRFGDMLGKKAELLGGAILVAIGIKSLF